MKRIFDMQYAKDMARGCNLKVTLKKNFKGVSLYAKKNIKKGSVIAYYKFMVYRLDTYEGQKDNMYSMSVYTKGGRESNTFIGDIYEGSLDYPKNNIPFWAYFSNEPSKKQKENCYIDTNDKENYKNRNRVKEGDVLIYKLIATRNIKKGQEIVWCYGDAYDRGYEANCQ